VFELFSSFQYPELENPTEYVSLKANGEYPLYEGKVTAYGGKPFSAPDYAKHIEEETIYRSTAKYARIDGKPYMTGALARINNNRDELSPGAKRLLRKSGMPDPCHSTFMNNVAQTIEMVHCAEAAECILRGYAKSGFRSEKFRAKPAKGEGVAACEAPRGTLYHHYRFDSAGRCRLADIITPTCQNVRNMESDIKAILPSVSGKGEAVIRKALEMLIRAYDPCFSCSTHFLELKIRKDPGHS